MHPPGAIVRFRKRDWVVLPSEDPEVILLRPLTGTSEEAIGVHLRLSDYLGKIFEEERIRASSFPLPDPSRLSDAQSVHLLWQSARLLLREGAVPFRSLGRISFRPRAYQLVPLMMSLRLDPVRLLIADDVGVGKTIETGLIVRELWDRGEIRRFAVLCPPYLTDQWAKELKEKFAFTPVVIASGTLGQLERKIPSGESVYRHFPIQVISIDFVKFPRNRYLFLQDAPEFIIVDEAHGVVPGPGQQRHLRYELINELAQNPSRHLILVTATPHSGIEESFKKLIGLLRSEFESWDTEHLTEDQRKTLAFHFIQRTRKDIQNQWEEGQHLFPERIAEDHTYSLSQSYLQLYEETYNFGREIVRTGETLKGYRRRLRYWSALSLLRCIMSSPRAAKVALEKRRRKGRLELDEIEEEQDFSPYVYEPSEDISPDEPPTSLHEKTERVLSNSEKKKLQKLERLAESLSEEEDQKLQEVTSLTRQLLREGYYPVIWCFYVDTVGYVAEKLQSKLMDEFPDLQVLGVTGRMSEEERRMKVEALMKAETTRVLVSTDCLAEGINLQEGFNAVIHYDLPWNPNRLEQREGRVDRFGQQSKKVKVIRFYGQNNPVDGAILKVLLDKARQIRDRLGTHVPIPENDEAIIDALIHYLFHMKADKEPELFNEPITRLHLKWELLERRERETRTRFAQRSLKPDVVYRELKQTDEVLGDSSSVKNFTLSAVQRLGLSIRQSPRNSAIFHIPLSKTNLLHLPPVIRDTLPQNNRNGEWRVTFVSPPPDGAEFLSRNHPFVTALAQYLFEQALEGRHADTIATRCGAIRTETVRRLTTLVLLRNRYKIYIPGHPDLLAEEVQVLGWKGFGKEWIPSERALQLLNYARPAAEPFSLQEKQELVSEMLRILKSYLNTSQNNNPLWTFLAHRAQEITASHKRVRQTLGERIRGLNVEPHWPPDILGLVVLQPTIKKS